MREVPTILATRFRIDELATVLEDRGLAGLVVGVALPATVLAAPQHLALHLATAA